MCNAAKGSRHWGLFVVSAGCLEASYKRFDVVCRDVL